MKTKKPDINQIIYDIGIGLILFAAVFAVVCKFDIVNIG